MFSSEVLVNKEEQVQLGNMFVVKIPKIDVKDFAMIILTLTNIKSSLKAKNILEISTVHNSNSIYVDFENDEKEENKDTIDYAIKLNTLDIPYEIDFIGNQDIVTILGEDLAEAGLIEDMFEFKLKGEC